MKDKCPCGSGQEYSECCHKYHDGLLPENALKLMKSRYSAFSKKDFNYIYQTFHPDHPSSKESYEEFVKNVLQDATYEKLEILDFQDGEKHATVTFVAHMKVGNMDTTFTEKSTFEKIGDRWLYKSGMMQMGRVPDLA